jgi:hypothetical protein
MERMTNEREVLPRRTGRTTMYDEVEASYRERKLSIVVAGKVVGKLS